MDGTAISILFFDLAASSSSLNGEVAASAPSSRPALHSSARLRRFRSRSSSTSWPTGTLLLSPGFSTSSNVTRSSSLRMIAMRRYGFRGGRATLALFVAGGPPPGRGGRATGRAAALLCC